MIRRNTFPNKFRLIKFIKSFNLTNKSVFLALYIHTSTTSCYGINLTVLPESADEFNLTADRLINFPHSHIKLCFENVKAKSKLLLETGKA